MQKQCCSLPRELDTISAGALALFLAQDLVHVRVLEACSGDEAGLGREGGARRSPSRCGDAQVGSAGGDGLVLQAGP